MKRKLLLIISLAPLLAFSQQRTIVAVKAVYDSSAVTELYNRTAIGLIFTYSDSSHRATTGYLHGDYKWKQADVSTSNGNLQNGFLVFNRMQLAQQHYQILLTVNTPENAAGKPLQAILTLPHVIGIRFNHYTDSLKREIPFYLNVEGKFNSGKIFPLDTTLIRFSTSAGQLNGQNLVLEKNDTTRLITVEAWYKPNPNMYLRSVIPVKQLPDKDIPPMESVSPGRRRGRH
ncbi:hypothetical protein [Chitinophaga vietnamensis]|uniref:hypothetical protein n=1 Tax=Chitinophaga vietnamensis TaxID=2593957 RepID=UPI0011784652|nr:hypothetical protein [Chitinophaga vietnamensis]